MLIRYLIVGTVVLIPIAAASVVAQTKTGTSPDANAPVTVTGCVSGQAGSRDFTLTDSSNGSKYRLTGKSVRKYAGQRVEVVSGRSKRLAVRGGLWPSPNAAAQAGAIDPAQESIARQPGGGGTGSAPVTLPELNVVSVRGLDGKCQ